MEFLVAKEIKRKSSCKIPCDIIDFLMKCKMTVHPIGPLRSDTQRKINYPQIM